MPRSDEELVQLCQRELPYVTDAFEDLMRRYEAVVHRTCLRYLRRGAEADDATQDVFIRVFRSISRFQRQATFKTWLFRIAANVCASRYAARQRQRRLAEAAGELIQTAIEVEVDAHPRLDAALASLSPDDREILMLRHVAELSFEELAVTLELGLSASKMRLYRAEDRLRGALADS